MIFIKSLLFIEHPLISIKIKSISHYKKYSITVSYLFITYSTNLPISLIKHIYIINYQM